MSARVQASPFRETEFDQRLDRMLDDLKNTVTDDEDNSRRTPIVRSSSRSSSRAGSIGHRGGGSYISEGVGDGGRLTHHRKEYTSPDQSVRTVADTYQYDSGDTHPAGSFQKKVVKSTYSSYNVDGGLSNELNSLKRGPSDREMEQALSQESRNILNSSYSTKSSSDNKVIDASEKVAKELVGALSCIGKDGRSLSNSHFDDDMIVNDEKGGEVRRIVWRNRYEKTYETKDSPGGPTISIERDARNRRYNNTTDINDVTNISSLTRPHVPPQIASPPATGYSHSANSTNYNKTTNITEVHKTSSNNETVDTLYPVNGKPTYPSNEKPGGPNSTNYSINTTNYHTESHHHPFPTTPSDKGPSINTRRSPSPPSRHPHDPNRNITININKTTTHTTRTTSSRDDYPGDGSPLTSTPYRGRSGSPPDGRRFPSGPSDSLDRVRRHPQPGLPFPETSPVKPNDTTRIPRKMDDLLSEFPERNGGPYPYNGHPDSEPLLSTTNVRRREAQHTKTEIVVPPPERNEINTVSPTKLREEREKTKNLAGPPVYYPPGHEQFSESMHTMTLKEGGRRGKAKWRKEAASGYKESSSHSESQGGMKMVPLCLPLCCGAACSIM